MDSLKTSLAGIVGVNTLIEIGIIVYFSKQLSGVSYEFGKINNDLKAIANKLVEVDSKSNHLGGAINEFNKSITNFNKIKGEMVGSINELYHFKTSIEQRVEQVEQYLDIIIAALEEKDIKINIPKPKPVSRFGRVHLNVEDNKKVTFGNSSTRKIKNTDDEEENEGSNNDDEEVEEIDEEEDLKALKEFQEFKKKKLKNKKK